jgi:hypothetical protein
VSIIAMTYLDSFGRFALHSRGSRGADGNDMCAVAQPI